MKVKVNTNRKLYCINGAGTQNENNVTELNIEVPKQYEDFNKKIVFITKDNVVWDMIEDNTYKLTKAITKYSNVKFYIWLTKDEQDFGSRMLLNFGHTIGHALEKIGCYKKISHGEAVSIGMNEITRISESMNLTRFEVPQRLKTVCKKYFLPTNNNFSRSQLQKAVLHDKKILNGYLNLVLIKDIGKSFIYKISDKEFINFLKNEI